jgi:hypothetical protein
VIFLLPSRRSRSLALLLGALSVLCLAKDAAASDEDSVEPVLQRLFLGEAVYSQERFELQTSAGIEWTREGRQVDFAVPVEVEFGITDHFQLAVEAPARWVRLDTGVIAGIGNAEVSAFYNVIARRSLGLSFSAGLGFGFPASATELGSSSFGVKPLLVGYQQLGPLHLNASVEAEIALPSGSDAAHVGLEAALGAFVPLGRLVPTLELMAEIEDESSLSMAPGLLWHPWDNLELGGAILIGLTKGAADAGLLLSATWEIELGKHRGDVEDREEASR